LQYLLGLPSPRLGHPTPAVDRPGRDPRALDVLDNLLGDLGQLARRRPRPELLEPLVGRDLLGGRQHAFGLLNRDPAGQCLAQLRHFEVPTDRLRARMDQLGGESGEGAERHHLLGRPGSRLVAWTSSVPTGRLSNHTGTLSTPRTSSWSNTAATWSHRHAVHDSPQYGSVLDIAGQARRHDEVQLDAL